MIQPTEPAPPPYQRLLARLEKERAHHQECAALSRTDEGRIAHSGMAAGFLHAAIHLMEETEGPGAARQYMERTTAEEPRRWPGGRHTVTGPAGTPGEDPPEPEYEAASAAESTAEQSAREVS
ncbi:hypothetical protein [Streptomyces himastatinicus]|nr:hypothetical protein [Streptomyces himastatinicus]